jgi:hypothetical protein
MIADVDDATIAELRSTIDEHKDARASQALEALAAIRDDRALRHIQAIATHKGKLGKRAAQIFEEVAWQRGLTLDELEDRIVPELGLDERGTLTFDYAWATSAPDAPRTRFMVGFDEQLEPFVRDESGNRLKVIPQAKEGDDPAKAAKAAETWKRLKEEVRAIGPHQAKRLERAMCAERQWTASAFAGHLIGHRVLGHLARRLVFRVASGSPTFRVGEDGAYADSNERPVSLDASARVVLLHPATLDDGELARWREVFVDHQIVQPFPQLEREVPTMTDDELRTTSTERFAGVKVTSKHFWSLSHRGWTLGYHPTKRLASRVTATLVVSPGLEWYAHGAGAAETTHELGALTVSGKTFGALGKIDRAELLRDVELLRG